MRILRLAIACILLWGGARSSPAADADWTPASRAALAHFQAGEYDAARDLCAGPLAGADDPLVRRDAAALRAMLLMQGPARTERRSGVVEFDMLARAHRELLARPECQLALGTARLELNETAAALEHLDAAAGGFAAQRDAKRHRAALVALAEGWTRHTEWEHTPGRFGISRPADRAAAERIREQQVAKIREALAQLPDSTAACAALDLVWARHLLAAGDRAAEARDLLARVAALPLSVPAAADAALALGAEYEVEQRWGDALAMYARLQAEASGPLLDEARARQAAITKPQLQLSSPPVAPADRPVRLELGTRNVSAFEIEVRRLDLPAWLASRQGRLIEAQLPAAGSVQFAQRFTTSTEQPYDWWHAPPVEVSAPPGAYVVSMTAMAPVPATVRQLLLISDLVALTVMGDDRVLVWATARSGAAAADLDISTAQARFWMHGSFMPVQLALADGLARFALPPEARVLRERRWVCLVQAGEHLALCRGEVPPPAAAPPPLLLATDRPQVGRPLTVTGLAPPGLDSAAPATDPWRLEVRDPLDSLIASQELAVSAGGVLHGALPVPAPAGGQTVRLVARRGEQSAQSLAGSHMLPVPWPGAAEHVLACRVPTHVPPDNRAITGTAQAWHAWGTPVEPDALTGILRVADLPSPATNDQFESNEAVRLGRSLHGDEYVGVIPARERTFAVDIPARWLTTRANGPAAAGIWLTGTDDDRNATTILRLVAIGAAPAVAWVRPTSAECQVGRPVRIEGGWFDPSELTGWEPPEFLVREARGRQVHLAATAEPTGWWSAQWSPEQSGPADVQFTAPREGSVSAHATRTLLISPAPAGDRTPSIACSAEWLAGAQPTVRVRLTGESAAPLLVLLESGAPHAAEALDELHGERELSLPLASAPRSLRVLVVDLAASGTRVLARAPIAPPATERLELAVDTPGDPPAAGAAVNVHVRCTGPPSAVQDAWLIARLTPATTIGPVLWIPGDPRRDTWSGPALPQLIAGGVDSAGSLKIANAETQWLPREVYAALRDRETLWTTAVPAARDLELSVPLPPQPDRYRLDLLACSARGAISTAQRVLDARSGVHLRPDVPARLTLGDRCLVGIAIENPATTPVTGTCEISFGAGLQAESIEHAGTAQRPANPGAPLSVTVPAGGHAWIQARVEAVRAGHASLGVTFSGDLAQTAVAEYDVLELDERTSSSAVQVKRTVLLLARGHAAHAGEPDDAGAAAASPVGDELHTGDRIFAGQRILVRDAFTVPSALAAVTWSQRLPPGCVANVSPDLPARPIGRSSRRRGDELRFETSRLAGGDHVHEFVLTGARPGACTLPAPQIESGGRPLPVQVEPADWRIVVIENRPGP